MREDYHVLRTILRGGVAMAVSLIALLAVVTANASLDQPVQAQPLAANDASPALRATSTFTIDLQLVANGLSSPVYVTHAGDGSGRLFVVEQTGAIRVIKNGVLSSTPFFSLTDKIFCCGERGLLSMAFDPDYKTNGVFYVYYTALNGDVTIERYIVATPASDVASIISSTLILAVAHPAGNHNGGQLQFGPDGYLYAGLGDGGGAGDQHGTIGNGQDPAVLLGKILRLNVRGVPTYTIPASNPFTQTVGYRPEIWALGLRNPWRFSFDRSTGDLYIGDVGQDCYEEIDYQPVASHGGENYGWRRLEGFHAFDPANMTNCSQPTPTPPDVTLPIVEVPHPTGEAIVGGYVYRGNAYPAIRGVYFYADEVTGQFWTLERINSAWVSTEIPKPDLSISSFGEDESGELYAANYNTGTIYKIISAPTASPSIDLSTSTKTALPSTVQRDNVVTYTIVLRNTGDPFYDTVRVTDTVPAGLSYAAGSLAATSGVIDASAAPTLKWHGTMSTTPTSIVTITYRALLTAGSSQLITNTATIDPVLNPPLTRSATITVTTSSPNLSGSTKQAAIASAQWNAVLTYTIVLRNSGQPFSATVRVTDTIPTGLTYLAASFKASRGTPDDSAAPTLKWSGDMLNTSAVTISYRAVVTAFTSQTLNNTATIDPGFSAPFNRLAAVAVNGPTLTNSAKLISAVAARSGEVVSYTIVVRNTGGLFPTVVHVTDTLPSSLAYVPGSLTASSGTPDDSAAPTLKWSGVMSTTPVITLTYAVSVATTSAKTITNTALINPGYAPPFARAASVIVNPRYMFLPVILRN